MLEERRALVLELRVDRRDVVGAELRDRAVEGANDVVAHVRLEHAPGGERSRAPGHDHLADLELFRQPGGVHRPGAAEGNERVFARIDSLLDRDGAHGVRHLRVDDREHALGECDVVEAHLRPDRVQGPLRGLLVQRHASAEEVAGIEPTEEEVRVGDRRLRAPAPVAGGPGSAPADCGPTRRPPASSHASEPPPAPIVWMSTRDISTGRPSSSVSIETLGCPSTIRLRSKDVPPMSMQRRFGRPVERDRAAPPIVPPTGPESSVCTGCSRALRAVVMPPFDCMT